MTKSALRPKKRQALTRTVVTIDGVRWRQISRLSASRAADRHFIVKTGPDGSTTIRFGDGVHGASPRTATKIDVVFRTGVGHVRLSLRRTRAQSQTRDQALWVAIRNRTKAVAFSG